MHKTIYVEIPLNSIGITRRTITPPPCDAPVYSIDSRNQFFSMFYSVLLYYFIQTIEHQQIQSTEKLKVGKQYKFVSI